MSFKISYILKQKNLKTEDKSDNSCVNYADRTLFLNTWTFKNTLMNHLKLKEAQCIISDEIALSIEIIDNSSYFFGLKIVVYESIDILILDVSISLDELSSIRALELFDQELNRNSIILDYCGNNVSISADYKIIKTYDDVSSYYCKLIYSKLNDFDRKMRLLVYNTYYFLYKKDFSNQFNYYTDPDEKRLKPKGKNGQYKNCSEQIFYLCDYSQLISILFGDNNSITNQSSDWELFFQSKIDFKVCRQDLEKMKGFRNSVAHCKLFSKKDYDEYENLLDKYICALNKAIELTYSKDFYAYWWETVKNNINTAVDKFMQIYEEFDFI
ncbi:MAG: hypothetical protein IKL10_03435 [Clostridia bacterium]|nr:hypothetical protein [Clostridia bacterium]